MSITSLEIKEYPLRKSLFGYDKTDVENLRELGAEAIEEATKELGSLKDDVLTLTTRLDEHEKREAVLKDSITMAQTMVDELKTTARKEAELLVAEARHKADEIASKVTKRVSDIQHEIIELKRKRKTLESTLRSSLEHHMSMLELDKEEAEKKDTEAEKVKFISK